MSMGIYIVALIVAVLLCMAAFAYFDNKKCKQDSEKIFNDLDKCIKQTFSRY